MSFAFRLLIILIAGSPITLLADGPALHGLFMVYVALIVAVIGFSMPPGEASHFANLIRPVIILAAVPAMWMLVQALPLPIVSLANPIWASAQASLSNPPVGHVSIDPGATLLSLARYLFAVGILLAAAAVTIDRQRAERLLSWLTFMTSLAAVGMITHDLAAKTLLGEIYGGARIAVSTAAALGVVLALAKLDLVVERYETRRGRPDMSWLWLFESLAAALIGFLACSFAVLYFAPVGTKAAAAAGLITFSLVVAIRRLRVGPWVSGGVAVAAVVAFSMFAASQWGRENRDVTLRFAQAPASQVAASERMTSDASWAGSGAGAFAALQSIYRDIDEPALRSPPTAAAALKIELGSVSPWIALLILATMIALLLRGAFRRGRDSFYPAAAASCLVLLTIQGFSSAGPLETVPVILAMAIVGLGLAQSESRSIKQ